MKMDDQSRIRANIRSLRKAFMETQEELGAELHVEKSAISNYETGSRDINNNTISAISHHFMVSIEELMYSNYSNLGRITVNYDFPWKAFRTILPIISSDSAMKNKHFKKAFDAHNRLYDQLYDIKLNGIIDAISVCFEEYESAYEDEESETIKAEIAANALAIWYFFVMYIKVLLKCFDSTAVHTLLAKENDNVITSINDIKHKYDDAKTDFKELSTLFNGSEDDEWLSELKISLKKSVIWSDLADYYLTFQYIFNTVDNGLSAEFNRRVGVEMLYTLISVKNEYANNLYSLLTKLGFQTGSQIVDDKKDK